MSLLLCKCEYAVTGFPEQISNNFSQKKKHIYSNLTTWESKSSPREFRLGRRQAWRCKGTVRTKEWKSKAKLKDSIFSQLVLPKKKSRTANFSYKPKLHATSGKTLSKGHNITMIQMNLPSLYLLRTLFPRKRLRRPVSLCSARTSKFHINRSS